MGPGLQGYDGPFSYALFPVRNHQVPVYLADAPKTLTYRASPHRAVERKERKARAVKFLAA